MSPHLVAHIVRVHHWGVVAHVRIRSVHRRGRVPMGRRRQGEDRRRPLRGRAGGRSLPGRRQRGPYGACGRRGVHTPSDSLGHSPPGHPLPARQRGRARHRAVFRGIRCAGSAGYRCEGAGGGEPACAPAHALPSGARSHVRRPGCRKDRHHWAGHRTGVRRQGGASWHSRCRPERWGALSPVGGRGRHLGARPARRGGRGRPDHGAAHRRRPQPGVE